MSLNCGTRWLSDALASAESIHRSRCRARGFYAVLPVLDEVRCAVDDAVANQSTVLTRVAVISQRFRGGTPAMACEL